MDGEEGEKRLCAQKGPGFYMYFYKVHGKYYW